MTLNQIKSLLKWQEKEKENQHQPLNQYPDHPELDYNSQYEESLDS